MSRAIQARWIGQARRQASAALRLCAALWLVLYIVYTPIHLNLEPHSDEADFKGATPGALATVADESHNDDHERHTAAQHKLKALRSHRAPVPEMALVTVVKWVAAQNDCPQPQVFEFSGLSPPELPRCWQFLFRTALPVRAPSLLS